MESTSAHQPLHDLQGRDQPQSAKDTDASARGKQRKVTRRDPEKRRLQNQRAQKKYREKRKRHMIELESLVASVESRFAPELVKAGDSTGVSPEVGQSSDAVVTVSERPHDAAEVVDLPPADWTVLPAEQYASALGSAMNLPCQSPTSPGWEVGPSATWSIEFFACGCKIPHIEVRTRQCAGHPEHRLAAFNFFPDPYINTLRIERLCIVEAMRQNCLMLGITEYMWCSDDTVSPFFRPATSQGADGVVQSVQSIFMTLKPDMRPSFEQITVCHHPYIDIIPFPTVRKNLIRSLDSIDEDEFFYDSLNGLMCWGGAGADGRNITGTGTGTPWDVRSWEAKEWFLRKWWLIVGGEEGELTRQSRWWRSFRGEDAEGMLQLSQESGKVISD